MTTTISLIDARLRALRRRATMRRHTAPTFVFADLAGYTALTERLGDEMAATVAHAFGRTVRGLCRRHRAWHVKSMGDGVMICVPSAAAAVALAAGAVAAARANSDLPPVRVGVHTGPAVLRGFDWYGSAVNVAARLADVAEPGEALISHATRSAAHGGFTHPLRDRREIRLHGVERPIVAWGLA